MAPGPRARGGERWPPRLAWAVVLLLCLSPGTAAAEERFVLIVSGASGAQEYAATFSAWTTELARTLTHRFNLDASRLVVLSESDDATVASTAANVRRAITLFQRRMTRDDVLLVVLIGHGTFDGIDAKFNLVGPDLEAAQWAALLDPVPGRVVLVNTTAASFPFLERLAGPRRVVIAATDSPAQRYQTVFPEYFIKAFADEAADLDKNGRVSIWEAFAAASAGVRRHYQQRGQLSTERALL
ncbi:MAG: caspase family protein, partial [Acidobacteria bacterium]|nr:caspase family protein [Acidobacteriota bacterium]